MQTQKSGAYPQILDGDDTERTCDSDEDNALMRKVASESIVLLKNQGQLLPLKAETLKKVAIIGPNAKARAISGGGSASLKPSYVITPYDGIVKALPGDVDVLYSEGAIGALLLTVILASVVPLSHLSFLAYQTLPSLDYELVTDTGAPGWTLSWHNHGQDNNTISSEVLKTEFVNETNIFLVDAVPPSNLDARWGVRLSGKLRPRPATLGKVKFEFGLIVTGRAKLFVDGKLVIDNWTKQRQGQTFFGMGTLEETGVVEIAPGHSPHVLLEFSNIKGPRENDVGGQPTQAGMRLGGRDMFDADQEIQAAVECARAADVAVLVVGLNNDWESEGYDRTTLALPGRTDELVAKVAQANPKTVVVTQSVGDS